MKIQTIADILDARIVCDSNKETVEIRTVCGSDMMSDVMAFVKDQTLLLTGLVNVQVIRTANLLDIEAICFVRGKEPTEEMITMANEHGIVLLTTEETMFFACGKLYAANIVKNDC